MVNAPLRRDRPLWEITVVGSLADDQVALVLKLRHAVADGGSSARIITRIMDGQERPDHSPVDPVPSSGTWVVSPSTISGRR